MQGKILFDFLFSKSNLFELGKNWLSRYLAILSKLLMQQNIDECPSSFTSLLLKIKICIAAIVAAVT